MPTNWKRDLNRLLLFALACGFVLGVLTGRAYGNYPSQVSKLLDVNATTLIVANSGTGGSNLPLTFAPGSGQRMRITVTSIKFEPSNTTYTACADPCTATVNRNGGQQYLYAEITDGSGVPLSPRKRALRILPQVEIAASTPGNWTFPIEVVGQDNYVRRVQVTNPGSVRTNLRLGMWINNHGCGVAPFDQKMSVQVNGGAATASDGNWIAIRNSTIVQLDENYFFGSPWLGGNGTIPNGSIGGAPGTIYISVAIPDNLVSLSTNTIGLRNFCEDGRTSGYRVLHLNFQDTTTIKTVSSIAVTSNVATATTSASHGYSTNDWVFLYNAPGMNARFNRHRQVASAPSGTTFTFTPCGRDSNTILTGACTSPNGTYTVPTSQNPSVAMATQPAAKVVKLLLAEPVAAWEDPTAWAAPSGSDATAGGELWRGEGTASVQLVQPYFEYFNNTMLVSCADCHTETGIDLKYHAFSNYSIRARSVFHGLTDQQGDNIAAFIRASSVTVPASGRPWNPSYQPGPGLYATAINNFGVGAGIESVLTYGNDIREYMAPGGSYANLLPDARLNMIDIPLMWQSPDWLHWLPSIHPIDGFQGISNFATFQSGSECIYKLGCPAGNSYLDFRAAAPANFDAYKAKGFSPFTTTNAFKDSIMSGYNANSPAWVSPSLYRFSQGSLLPWAATKVWELEHEFSLETMCSAMYTDIFGAAASPVGYLNRCWFSGTPFSFGYHKANAGGGPPGGSTLDNSNASADYQSNAAYIPMQMTINYGNLRQTGDRFMDVAYTWGFLAEVCQFRPCDWHMMLPAFFVPQSSWDQPLVDVGLGVFGGPSGTISPFQINIGTRYGWSFTSFADISLIVEKWVDALIAMLAPKGNNAAWAAVMNNVDPNLDQNCTANGVLAAYGGSGRFCDAIAFEFPQWGYFGVPSGKLDTIQTWAQAVWPGHNFAYDRSAAATGVINISSGTATWVSGTNFANFAVAESGSPAIKSSLFLTPFGSGQRYPITGVASNTSLTLGGSPPNGTGVTYKRCSDTDNPGGQPPAWIICGNVQ